jgi:MYXO-CTERM domain-containing protein
MSGASDWSGEFYIVNGTSGGAVAGPPPSFAQRDNSVYQDNVVLDPQVQPTGGGMPEPSTVGIAAGALAILAFRRPQRRRSRDLLLLP